MVAISSPISNNPHRAMLKLNKKPSKVSRIPFFVDSDLAKAKTKTGAMIIAGSQ
jgi:hypothetical protein